jgi:hypothetical protein
MRLVAAEDVAILVREIEAWCAKRRMSTTTFGRKAVNDGKFVSRLKRGGRLCPRTAGAVRRVMDSGMPNYVQPSRRKA